MVSLSRSHGKAHGLRPMNPLRDWGRVARLMQVAFQTEVSHPSLPLLPDWRWLRWLRPVVNFFEAVGRETPEQMLGFVWEEGGQIVGNATLGLSDGQDGMWLLSNVAVHPEHRRRGIARALVEAALSETRRQGGRWLTLQVKGDNHGARELYLQTGFRTLETVAEFAVVNLQVPAPLPSAARLVPPTREQWNEVKAMAAAHLPPDLWLYRYSLSGLFNIPYRRNWLEQSGELLGGIQRANWSLLRGETVVGGMVVQTQLNWGAHRAACFAAPDAPPRAEDLMLAQAVQQTQRFASRRIQFLVPASYAELCALLRWHGARELRALELMGLEL